MKMACEAAKNAGAKLEFLGSEFNQNTINRLFHETRLNLVTYLWRQMHYQGFFNWTYEHHSNAGKLHLVGPSAFSEKCLDRYLMNWYVASMNVFFPYLKRVLIDKRGEDIFRQVQNTDHKKVVVVVNQWHMEAFEHNWAHMYGQLPRSVETQEPINPIGDMNLRELLFETLYNALHREISSAQQKSAPSTYADWIIGYHRESNM
jgi:pheromone shutdown protein TraB